MADKKFDLVFNASLEVGQVKAAVASLTKSLESAGAKIPQSVTTNLNRMIQSLSTELNKLEGMTDIQLDPKNAKNVGKSYENIFQTFQQIKAVLGDIHRTAGIDPEKFFPSEVASNITKAAQAVQKYKKAMEAGIKTDEHTRVTKDIAKATKETEDLQKKLNEATRKRDEALNTKSILESQRADLQAKKESAEAEVEAAKKAEKTIKDKVEARKKLEKIEKDLDVKKKAREEATVKAARANELKTARETKDKGSDTIAYKKDLNEFERQTKAVVDLSNEIEQLEKEKTQLNQIGTASDEEQSAAIKEVTQATNRLIEAQTKLKKKQNAIDTEDNTYATAVGEIETLTPAIESAEQLLEQLGLEKKRLEETFKQNTFDELIKELKELGVKFPEAEDDMEDVKKALENMATEAKGNVTKSLEKVKKATEDVNTSLEKVGPKADELGDLGEEAKRAEQDMENLKNQVLDFFSITNTIQIFKNAIRDAFETVKELDAAMTETAVVTDFSVGDMWDKLPEYSEEATKLGASIKSLYEATTLYYQQGLQTEEAMGVGIETMKMARIANMDAAQATEAMTAALRGFNMEINETSATRINDVYSELAAVTAADTSQIATAMGKTASIASSANMEFETTAALLAQIIETTQEAPETAGTAMKTIIARFTEVKQLFSQGLLTGEDSEGETIEINKIDAALKTVGISLKDFLTGAKGIDDIFLELASKWNTLDLATQRYIATTAAGSRQQSRFLAMMGNYDRTMELVNAATNSAGASQKQFGKTLDSLDAKLQKLKNAWDTFTMGLANSELIKIGVDILTGLLEIVNNLTEAFDGIGGSVAKVGLAIMALKAGKGLFNVFTGQAYSAGAQTGSKFAAGLAASLSNISIQDAAKNLENDLLGIGNKMKLLNQGSLMLGMGLKFVAQQMEDTEFDEYSDAVSNLGTAVLALSAGLQILTPIAAAANMGVGKLLATIGTAALPYLPLIAAIAGIGLALHEVWKNSPEQVLKRTKEYAEEAGEAADEAAKKYEDLKTSFSSLASSEEALQNLTMGTQEWKDAVVDLNNEILKLVELYPELAELVSFKEGHLTIDYDSEQGQEIQKQLQSRMVASQIASIAAKVATTKQEEQVYYHSNIQGLNPLRTQEGAIEKLATAIYNDPTMGEASKISEWLDNNDLDFANTSAVVNQIVENLAPLREYAKVLETTQNQIASYNALTQSSLISTMDTDQYNEKTLNLLTKIQTPVQEYADSWNKNNEVNKSNFAEYGKEYAEALFGIGATANINHLNNKVTLSSADGKQTRELEYNEFKSEVAYQKGTEQASQQLEAAAQAISQMSEQQQGDLEKLLSSEGANLDLTALKDINIAGGVEQYVSKTFGTEVANNFEKIFGYTFEMLEENVRIATERSVKERGNLVKKMSKYSSKEMEGYEVNSGVLAGLELKFGEKINGILEGVLNSLEQSGDEAVVIKGFEQFRNTAMEGTKEELEEITSFVESVNWTNPIESADKLNQELITGSELTKQYAQGILEVGSSFLGASSQIQYFFRTEEYEAVKEELDEIITKNEQVSTTDVLDLAGEYKSLNKILKNTDVTAGGLAKTLELIAKGELGIHQLTKAVMSSLESFDSLDSIVVETLKTLSEFDPGANENEIADFINTAYETISDNLKSGAVGNSQNANYLDFLFPGWDDGLQGEELLARMEYLTNKLKDNSTNMRSAWSDLASGKDVYGKEIAFDEGSEWGAEDLLVKDTGSSIMLTGWEGKGMTTQDMVEWISDAYSVSENYAKMMLADFKNYSLDLAHELNANDYSAGLESAYESLKSVKVADPTKHSLFEQKIIDESEIKAIAALYNKTFEEVRKEFEGKAFITNFYDENGFLRDTSEIMAKLDQLAQSGGAEGAKWISRFIDGSTKNLDIDKLNSGLSEVGIPEEGQARITQDIVNSMLAASESGSVDVNVKLSDGSEKTVTVTPKIDLQTAINNAETELANSKLGEAVATAIKGITFSPEINGQDITNSIVGAIKAADGTIVTIMPDQESLNTIASSINTAVTETKPFVQVDSNIDNIISAINSIDKTIVVTVKYQEVGKPSGTNNNSEKSPDYITKSFEATGVKDASKSYNAFVSEEGPELIQTKEGVYLTGQNGPEFAHINKGDTVYTAEETRNILKKQKHNTVPRFAEGYGHGSAYQESGSSSDESEEPWENSFDKLYNLIREIDEELRQRERIERRYEKLLENLDASADKILKVSYEELAQLESERALQEQLVQDRRTQISQYQAENADLNKYASVTQNERGEDVLRINWDLIDSITDTDKGGRVEDYVSQLEEWFESLEEAEDALWEIEDAVADIRDRGKDEYFELEEAIKDALVQSYQDEIEKLDAINTSINDTNASLMDSIQKTLDKQRQERDNQRTEEDLAEKQRRLLYLQQDTSGANDLAILELQKEIAQGQEDYTDSLIDQKISELQEQNDEAARQREQQISLLQAQLDHYIRFGEIWGEVYNLMDEGLDKDKGLVRGSRLEELLKTSAGFSGMSTIGQMEWLKETNGLINQALVYLELGRQLEDIGVKNQDIEVILPDGTTVKGTVDDKGNVTTKDGKTYSNVYQGADGRYYVGDTPTQNPPTQPEPPKEQQPTPTPEQKPTYPNNTEDNITGIAEAIWIHGQDTSGWGAGEVRKSRVDTKIGPGAGNKVQSKIDQIASGKITTGKAKKALSEYYYKKFKYGGLADFTGPAWLDGTKARPELVLNSKDTQNFIQLKDILASLMTRPNSSSENNGDITYDIDINVESIGSDYDVEQVANKVKSLINQDARYRNNNSVSLMR